ncbi:MAG: hypothetical protein ABJ360_25155 [Roseobacter sp.]
MSAISLINPYAPQPASSTSTDAIFSAAQAATPIDAGSATSDAGLASDQSGQGSGNGTGTGGAQVAMLLQREKEDGVFHRPTPESVVEAQSESDPATEFLARQARQQTQAKALAEERAADRAIERATAAREQAEKAATPEYVMPNPLPTAPILQSEDE